MGYLGQAAADVRHRVLSADVTLQVSVLQPRVYTRCFETHFYAVFRPIVFMILMQSKPRRTVSVIRKGSHSLPPGSVLVLATQHPVKDLAGQVKHRFSLEFPSSAVQEVQTRRESPPVFPAPRLPCGWRQQRSGTSHLVQKTTESCTY